jgi:hypothetical protein
MTQVLLNKAAHAVDVRLQLERVGFFAKEKGTRDEIERVPIASHPACLDIGRPHRWIELLVHVVQTIIICRHVIRNGTANSPFNLPFVEDVDQRTRKVLAAMSTKLATQSQKTGLLMPQLIDKVRKYSHDCKAIR